MLLQKSYLLLEETDLAARDQQQALATKVRWLPSGDLEVKRQTRHLQSAEP